MPLLIKHRSASEMYRFAELIDETLLGMWKPVLDEISVAKALILFGGVKGLPLSPSPAARLRAIILLPDMQGLNFGTFF
jgi:hypothetical protein